MVDKNGLGNALRAPCECPPTSAGARLIRLESLFLQLLAEWRRTNKLLAARGGAVAQEMRRAGDLTSAEAFELFAASALECAIETDSTLRRELDSRGDGE